MFYFFLRASVSGRRVLVIIETIFVVCGSLIYLNLKHDVSVSTDQRVSITMKVLFQSLDKTFVEKKMVRIFMCVWCIILLQYCIWQIAFFGNHSSDT